MSLLPQMPKGIGGLFCGTSSSHQSRKPSPDLQGKSSALQQIKGIPRADGDLPAHIPRGMGMQRMGLGLC